jgi:hypothetical protein
VRLQGLGKLKKIHLIRTQSRNLPARSIVPQPTTLLCAPFDEISEKLKYPFEDSSDTLHRRPGFEVSGFQFQLYCFQKGTSMKECDHFMEVQGLGM